jgi:hypothetical protein
MDPRAPRSPGVHPGGAAEREDRDGELRDPVGADEVAHLEVGELGVEPGAQPGARGERELLGEQRSGVPEDVPVPALAVAPARAPRHTGDDERRRPAGGLRAELHEGVLDRPVGVHAGRKAGRSCGDHDVDLEREPRARRPRGPEEDQPSPAPLLGADDARREVEQPGQLGEIEGRGARRMTARTASVLPVIGIVRPHRLESRSRSAAARR